MHPTFYVGPLEFPAYFTFLTIGYLLAVMMAWRETLRTKGVDPNKFLDLSIIILVAGLVGARLLHVIADGYFTDYVNLCIDPLQVKGRGLPNGVPCVDDAQCIAANAGQLCHPDAGTCHQGRDCFRWIKVWYGGLAFYGGMFLATVVGMWYIHRHRTKMDFWKTADLAGFGISFGLIFGRVGCLFAGCCFGAVTEADSFNLVFPQGSPAWERHMELGLITRHAHESLPVIPTQVIQIITNTILFLTCYIMYKKWRKFDGQVFVTFLALYAIFRFAVEFVRDDHRGVWLGGYLSTSQILAIPALIASVWMGIYLRRRHLRLQQQAAAESPESPQEVASDDTEGRL